MIKHPGKLTTRPADITTTKIAWDSVMRTEETRYACLDVGDFYLETPLKTYVYMNMPLSMFTNWTRKQHNLDKHAHKSFVYWEVPKAICELLNAGRLVIERP